MANKALVGGFAAILLVAAVVGVVAGVMRTHHNSNDSATLSASSKTVQTVCAPTVHQDVCQQTLTSALNGDLKPKSIVQAAVNATIDKVKAAFDHAGGVKFDTSDPKNQQAITECKRLFGDAIEDLQAVLDLSNNFEDLQARYADVRVWLNAVLSYQVACTENIDDPELKTAITEAVSTVVQFGSIAISLFEEYSSVSKDIASQLNITLGAPKRRLMGVDGEIPSWFTSADRRLLRGRGGAAAPPLTPNAVVAQDGSGQFKSINAALAAMPKAHRGRYIIHVKAGVYKEKVIVDKSMNNVFMYGDGARKTIITGSVCNTQGVATSETATFVVLGQGFIAKSMGFSNTAGPSGHQAVALRVQGDMSAFFNCRMDGYQDTLYVQSNRQFYRNCVISGTVDFIFGDSFTVIQNSLIIIRKGNPSQQNTVTAQGCNDPAEKHVLVIQNCRIVPEAILYPERLKIKSYLGRPWKNYARTVFMENEIGDVIQPAGYLEWENNNMNTPFYGEYNNRGPGAVTTGRVKWAGVRTITRAEAQKYTAAVVLQTNGPEWLQYTGEKYLSGFKN